MLKVKSLYQLIIHSIFFIIILSSFFTFIIINNSYNELKEKIHNIENDYTNNQKDILKNYINYILKFMNYYYEENRYKKSDTNIKKDILNALEKLSISSNPNEYIFIYDENAILIYNPSTEQTNIGKSFLDVTNSNGKKVLLEILEASKNIDGGFVDYFWAKPEIKKEKNKLSFVKAYPRYNWIIGKGVYLDEIDRLIKQKENEYNKKISIYTLQITSLTILLILYSIFIYKNATILIVNDIKEMGKYFKKTEQNSDQINQNIFIFREFKAIANYANDAITNIKLKTTMLEELNKNLEFQVEQKTKELSNLLKSQKEFIRNSVHEINTPLAIIQANIDLLKTKVATNNYITNIESGAKIIQYIYDDLSYLIKKDRVVYEKEYLNFSNILKQRLQFFDEIIKSNSLYIINKIEDDIYIKFNQTELQRVIDNNLSNAVKYSFSNSTILVNLFYIDDENIEFSVTTHSKSIDDIDRIFEDFYRENSSRGGFGLGLKIVKDICDHNFVTITILSHKKETKFTYRFRINENTTS